MRNVVFILLVLLLAGCTTRAGVEEFTVYKRAFDDSRTVSTALIDRLAAAERASGRIAHFNPNRDGVDQNFNPAHAVYFSDQADPPLAAEYRRAIATIGRYNELMLAFATGSGFSDVTAQLDLLVSESTALAAPLVPSSLTLTRYGEALNAIVALGAGERSRAVFQSRFGETMPVLIGLIEEMKAKTPIAFRNLTFLVDLEISTVSLEPGRGDLVALRQRHMEARVLLSDWVVLLDRHIAAIRATQRAIENPRLGTVLSGTAEAVTQLRITVESIRANLAQGGIR